MGDAAITIRQDPIQNRMLPLGGKLYVPPTYMQISGAQAVALTSASHWLYFAFTPEVDFALSSIDLYKAVVTDADGVVTLDLYLENGTALHLNGALNGSITDVSGTATPNATSEQVGHESSKLIDNNSGTSWWSAAAPSVGTPQDVYLHWGPSDLKAHNKYRVWSTGANYPSQWTYQGYLEGVGWVVLATETGITDPGSGCYREFYANNATGYEYFRLNLTGRNGTDDRVEIEEIEVMVAESKPCPGTLLQSLGTKVVGAGAGWLRHAFDVYQLQRGIRYAVVVKGQASKSFSFSSRTWNTTPGSAFPDSVMNASGIALKTSTDGGGTWTANLQNSKPAMLNVILNSTANHSPQLVYGRASGAYDYLLGDGLKEIPAAGISLNCEALTAGISYYIYRYDNLGTPALEASTIGPEIAEGVEVKSGTTTRRLVGMIVPIERQTGYQAPIDVEDYRGVWYPGRRVKIGKRCPYTALTQEFQKLNAWVPWNHTSGTGHDYTVTVLTRNSAVRYTAHGTHYQNGQIQLAIGIDGVVPSADTIRSSYANLEECQSCFTGTLTEGLHMLRPIWRCLNSTINAGWFYLNLNSTNPLSSSYTEGELVD